MSFIGNIPAEAYSTVAKDTFSGNDSTTDFTLSIPATTNSVEVFVENVQQEPTDAYTISGTTLSFTAAPVTGTDNIYVIHRGPAVQQVVPPAGVAIDASTVTASSTISATGNISTEGDLKVEVASGGIYTITGTDTASNRTLTLPDEAGTVLTSGTPLSSFPSGFANGITMADNWRLTGSLLGSQTPITAWERHTTSLAGLYGSSGMSVSSGIFTFPSTGIYLVSFQGTLDEDGSGADNAVTLEIRSSDDNFSSNDDLVTYQQTQLNSSNARAGLNMQVVLTVTDTSNDKVKFHISSQLSSNKLLGSTNGDTLAVFVRLGDLA